MTNVKNIGRNVLGMMSVTMFIPFCAISFITRLVLFLYEALRLHVSYKLIDIFQVFSFGLLNDMACYVYIIAPLTIFTFIIPPRLHTNNFFRYLVYFFHILWIFILCFNFVAELTFWEEFGSRYNFVTVNPLIYNHEVITSIIEFYPVYIILNLVIFFSLLIFIFYQKLVNLSFYKKIPHLYFFIQAIIFTGLLVILWPPYNQHFSERIDNRFLKEISKNGLYNLFSSYHNNSLDYNNFYITLSNDQAFNLLKNNLGIKKSKKSKKPYDLNRQFTSSFPNNKYNVMVLNLEDFSSNFLDIKVKGQTITPVINDLLDKSINFDRYFSSGIRTVRGLEAMLLSHPPIPGSSIIRRSNNEQLLTINSVLKKQGYEAKFLYGGNSKFDNMDYFFSNNGFKVVDRNSIKEKITFSNNWGISDGDLYDKAIAEADQSYSSGKLFFNFILTTSSHHPYTFPNPNNIIDMPQKQLNSAIKYADYAVGEFLRKVKNKPWFDNTIFIITTDGCPSLPSKTDVTLKNYQIPFLIYAPKILNEQTISKVSSQVDFAPTVLDILGISYSNKFMGTSIFNKEREFAFVGNYQFLGFINNDKMVVLGPKYNAKFYKIDNQLSQTTMKKDQTLLDSAVSFYQVADYMFKNNLMRNNAK